MDKKKKMNDKLNWELDFVIDSNNMFGDPDLETSQASINSTELRKIHDPKSEKCAILESNIKHLELQHQQDLEAKDETISKLKLQLRERKQDLKKKDEIISNLKLQLQSANNMIKQVENENAEKVSATIRTIEDRNLPSTEMNSRQKSLDDIYCLETKFQLNLERLTLEFERQHFESSKVLMKEFERQYESSKLLMKEFQGQQFESTKVLIKEFERQQIESSKILMKSNCDVMALQEKHKETNNLKQSTTDLNDKQIPPIEQESVGIFPRSSAKNSVESCKTAEPGLVKHSIPLHQNSRFSQKRLSGALILVTGLDKNTANTDKLFNLLCLYGDVVSIHILEREVAAIVKMVDIAAVDRCFQYLNKIRVGPTGQLKIKRYDTFFISKETPMQLSDGSPPFKDYTTHPNRLLKDDRILRPHKNLYFHSSSKITKAKLWKLLISQELQPTFVRVVEGKPYGLIKFANTADAVWAIMKCNNMLIEDEGSQLPLIINFSQDKL